MPKDTFQRELDSAFAKRMRQWNRKGQRKRKELAFTRALLEKVLKANGKSGKG